MAIRTTVTAKSDFYVGWKCSKCNADNTQIVTRTATTQYTGIGNGKRMGAINSAVAMASPDIIIGSNRDFDGIYGSFLNVCQCKNCKHKEIWATIDDNISLQMLFGLPGGFLAFFGMLLLLALNIKGLIFVSAGIGLLLISNRIYESSKKKEQEIIKIARSVPLEYRPVMARDETSLMFEKDRLKYRVFYNKMYEARNEPDNEELTIIKQEVFERLKKYAEEKITVYKEGLTEYYCLDEEEATESRYMSLSSKYYSSIFYSSIKDLDKDANFKAICVYTSIDKLSQLLIDEALLKESRFGEQWSLGVVFLIHIYAMGKGLYKESDYNYYCSVLNKYQNSLMIRAHLDVISEMPSEEEGDEEEIETDNRNGNDELIIYQGEETKTYISEDHHTSRVVPIRRAQFCRKCGYRYPEDSIFCPQCGIKIT